MIRETNNYAPPDKIEKMLNQLRTQSDLLKSKEISLTDILSANVFYTSFSKILAGCGVVEKISGRYQYTGIEITKRSLSRIIVKIL